MSYHYGNEFDENNSTDHKTNTNHTFTLDPHSTVTTPLINRSQSEPSETAIKHNTLFVPSKIRDTALDDSYSGSIRRYSIETIPVKSSQWRQEKKEEIIVPARNHLVKMPFFTTPLTLESTNNPFYDFRERLIEMGFGSQAEAALVHTQCESVENAVTFILHNFNAIYHRFEDRYDIQISFTRNIDTDKLCAICSQPFYQHLLDQNGNKIQIDINEANFNNNDDLQEYRTLSMDRNYVHNLIQNTESLLPPSIMYNVQTELCLICFEDKPLDNFTASECGHNRYCKQCLTEHYKIKTKNGDVLKVKCIDPKCEREVKESEILNFLTDNELKQKFIKFKRQKLLMLDENARFCITTDCDGYMIGSRLRPKLVCSECTAKICFNCSKEWHGYFTKCSSAQTSQEHVNDAKFYQWELNKKENVKKCPKCKIRIEKNAGCNHMTCSSCKYQFCWLCKGKYSSVHYKGWNIFGCPGAQYDRSSFISIHSCPRCCPIWLRRLVFFIAFLILLPLIIAFGVLACVIYVTGFCIYGFCRCVRCRC